MGKRRVGDDELMRTIIKDRIQRAISNVLHAKTRLYDSERVLQMHQDNRNDAAEQLRRAEYELSILRLDAEQWEKTKP